MSKWRNYALSDIMHIIGGGTPKTSISEYWDGDIPWLSVVDFGNDNKRVFKTEKTITEKGLNNSSTKILKSGQIIISARGTVGELAVLASDMAFNQSCYGLDARRSICTNDFLYYLLKCKVSELKQNSHGAVFDTITKSTFENIYVNVPDLPTQTAIAEVLSSLDDKIELNNKINAELEALVQTLFKRWFVEFEFPNENGEPYKSSGGEMVESEMGMIPKGWEVGSFGQICKVVAGYAFKSKDFKAVGEHGILKIRNVDGKVVDVTNTQFVSSEVVHRISSKFRVEPGDILIAMTGAEVGKIGIVPDSLKSVWLNQRVGKFVPIIENSDIFVYQLFNAKSLTEAVRSAAMGSAQPNISSTGIESLKIVIPTREMILKYSQINSEGFQLLYKSLGENQTISKIRDTLLPKLISGDLEVTDLQTENLTAL